MDVQTAIAKAKSYVTEIFGPEGAYNFGLEEVLFDPKGNAWDVTIGFSRPWDTVTISPIIPVMEKRTYKIVEINDNDGTIVSVKNRHVPTDG